MDAVIVSTVTAVSKKFIDTMLEAYKERKKIELAMEELSLKRDAMRMEYNFRMRQLKQEHQIKIRYISEAFNTIRTTFASFNEKHKAQELFAQQQIQMSVQALTNPGLSPEDKAFYKEHYQNFTKTWTQLIITHDDFLLKLVDDSIRKLNAPLAQLNSVERKKLR